uniref:PGG domain-containing protein n=1 Tax=Nelumbo nucifera TaxID=4432 RepID=A0A822XLY8_NELNU|nr:TPA_asm: hypothetical protein HUJ06_022495 [Nelumbo nucifera]
MSILFVPDSDVSYSLISGLKRVALTAQIIKFLLNNTEIKIDSVNKNSFTAHDVLTQSPKDNSKDEDIKKALQSRDEDPAQAGTTTQVQAPALAGQGRAITEPSSPPPPGGYMMTIQGQHNPFQVVPNGTISEPRDTATLDQVRTVQEKEDRRDKRNWMEKKRETLMVVAVLIATMAFQVAVNPPGGVWQDDSPGDPLTNPSWHKAGKAILAYKNGTNFRRLFRFNTTGFVASLSIILLLVSGLPWRNRPFMWILMVALWVAITSMAFTYLFSLLALTPKHVLRKMDNQLSVAIAAWSIVMTLLLLGHTVRLILLRFNVDMAKLSKKLIPTRLKNFATPQKRNSNDASA